MDTPYSLKSAVMLQAGTCAGWVRWLLWRLLLKCFSCTVASEASSVCRASFRRPSGVVALHVAHLNNILIVDMQYSRNIDYCISLSMCHSLPQASQSARTSFLGGLSGRT